MFRNPRRTLAGVSRPGAAGRSQGRRRSATRGRASRSWVCAAMTSQVQRSAGVRGADLRCGPAEGLLEQPEGVFQVEATQEGLPPAVHVGRVGAGDRGPEPHRFGVAVPGQMVNLQPDQGALDDREFGLVVDPAAAAGQSGVNAVPAGRDCGAVAGGLGAGGVPRFGPGGGPVEGDHRAVLGRPPIRPRQARAFGQAQDPIRTQPPDQLHGQIGQDVGEAGDVVAGVGHDHDARIARAPLPRADQPDDHAAELGGGDRGGVVGGAESDRVQHRGPRGAPGLQRGDERVGPTRDQLRVVLGPAVDVAEQPLRAGRGVRAQPRADVHGQHDPPIGGSG